ncbi:GTPase-activating protein [Vibrio breoganii]|uniref:Der GTPase-activating protein YihI n=1 Tax=Vibrio breoganii TaxID=553239 RepID=UPI0002ECF93F|nr:Der GTPase-activating protein YihI [Vibrio breoganii]OEF80950.1 GTPase-activating protein [Vibrio breoganii 1C10]PMG82219.1 GTPase-activating protein [Vibrio breoganii]PMK32570.1 GTPase-activating protein [Vibrio breoganii]PMK40107.1 GTPase-activating protein [Vibrio breoganii]PML06783.1 GTPase-activating protein [Vibrio breoganii]
MSRHKKSRKAGSTGDVDLIVTRNRSEADVEGRTRKKLKKRKGQKAGARHSVATESKENAGRGQRDPRIGSKKKIPLIIEAAPKPTKQQRKYTAEQELEALENDAQLNVLLDRIENGESLGVGLQSYVDQKLDRVEVLMKQLGLLEPEEEELEEVVVPSKANKSKKAKTEDELLASFEDLDLSDFKD